MPITEIDGSDIFDGSLTHADISGSNIDGSVTTPSLRTLGTGSQQAASGDDSRFNSIGSEIDHKSLRHLQHFIDEGPVEGFLTGAYREVSGSFIFPSGIIWWESSLKVKKIVETIIERNISPAEIIKPTPIIWQMYDTDGITVISKITDDIIYNGIFEITRIRTISGSC